MPFTLKQIRYFVAAAETGSITEAGKRLHISQPSVSAAIAELEARFKVDLFVRHHAQGLSLTPAGARLLRDARSLLDHAEELRQEAQGLGQALEGDLHIGCFQTFAPIVMPGLIRAFAAAHPAIAITLHEDHVQGVLDGLRAGRVELALTYDLNLGPDLAFEPLVPIPLHAVLARRHKLANQPAVGLAELAEWPMVLLSLPQSRDYFLSLFTARGLKPRIAQETPSFETLRGLVASGSSFAVMHSRPASRQTLDGRQVAYVPIKDRIPPQALGLARLARIRATHRAEAFAALAKSEITRIGME
ncbi:MAG TPA: LysR family transcriptional regulator [Dongiaceae bacterium]|jgi:DNA-binding transcriptional LysR family regulator|nr:LysR family transcriptional regulator [Dongiaceae bacterium]